MIRPIIGTARHAMCKPRASGDDPGTAKPFEDPTR